MTASRCASDPVIRQTIAQLVTADRGGARARPALRRGVDAGGAAPTVEASEYKLYATELSRRRRQRVDGRRSGRGRSCACTPRTRRCGGRAESTYRYTVIDTIGGGASEIQKNIIARRKLGLPKNF